jgi:hypothetical protein
MSTKTEMAFNYLLELINAGTEFPDAIARTAERFRLALKDVEAIENRYDAL